MADELTAVLFALEAEARAFRRRRRDVLIVRTGMGGDAALRGLARVLPRRPRLVVSAGFCGSLVPAVRLGDIVRPGEVVTPDGERYAMGGALRLVTVARPILSTQERDELRQRTGADVVDMETAPLARACRDAGVAFASVRVVSDDPEHPLPDDLRPVLAGDSVRFGALLVALLKRPALAVELGRLAWRCRGLSRRLADAVEAATPAARETYRR